MNDRWNQLEQSLISRPRQRIHPESSQDLYLQLSHPDRLRQLALRLPHGTPLPDGAFQSTQALAIRASEDNESTGVVVELRDPNLQQVFDALVDDVGQSVATTATPEAAVSTLTLRIAHWSDLFRRLGTSPTLSDDERRGLFGELSVLNTIIELLGTSAADAWTGPHAANQDFQFGPIAIEVKTTARTLPYTLQIPNERELDAGRLEQLILIRLLVDEYPTGGPGVSLNQQVTTTRKALQSSPAHLETFDDSLSRTRYVPDPAYNEPLYTVRTETRWTVRDTFPRITAADLPLGVADVHYTIDPTTFTDYEITVDQFAYIFRSQP